MCSCKQNSSVKQVTSVKQIVKPQQRTYSSSSPQGKKVMARRIVFKRHM